MQNLYNRYRAKELSIEEVASEAAKYMTDTEDQKLVSKRIKQWIRRRKIKPGQAQREVVDDPNRPIYIPS